MSLVSGVFLDMLVLDQDRRIEEHACRHTIARLHNEWSNRASILLYIILYVASSCSCIIIIMLLLYV